MSKEQPRRIDWHARSAEEAAEALGVRADQGLSEDEAQERREEYGPNQLQQAEARAWWQVFVDQLKSMVVYLLGGAAILAFATGRWPEGIAVAAVIVVNTGIGFVSELKAVRSMAALRKMGEHRTRVRREGRERDVDAPSLVPGDIALLEAGDLVPADLRLIEAERLRVNEAPLTGESVPVDKTVDPVDSAAVLAERSDMLYKGTSLATGRALGLVVATGIDTELGHIAELTEKAEATVTPLQKRLDRLGRHLAWVTIVIASLVAIVGLLVRHEEAELVIETALALGIAAIPEGLPIVATIALARGMYMMARRNALMNRLTAVETLGATRVIFSDKTGTLTENDMELRKISTAAGDEEVQGENEEASENLRKEGSLARRVVELGVLCNTATLAGEDGAEKSEGDPTEIALLSGGRKVGLSRKDLLERRKEARVLEFDPAIKKMATFHEEGGRYLVAVKGAPDAVLEICSRMVGSEGDEQELDEEGRGKWHDKANELAAEGLRLLAMAEKHADSTDADPYEDLVFVGLVGLLDPPRRGVRPAIDTCQAAGIRVEMVTGDQPETAKAIGRSVGIVGGVDDPETVVMMGKEFVDPDELDEEGRQRIYRANIFARISPEQKLNLVRIYQDAGEIVAMTGDGINDAPALKQADIGVAMGRRGTEAARQVADMVLKDDAFETIVAAVEQGRIIFNNIRKSVMFMLCTNVAEVLAVTSATMAGLTLPLRPLQILYLNVLTDVFPALALGVGPGSGVEMKQPPRDPKESVLTRHQWIEVASWASVIAASVLASLLLAEHWLGLEVDA
ncbi:MAG: cation-translocating P-type ATPase, partial [Myxococcota bacterium]